MTKDSVADVLRALATGDKSRSETARLRDIVDVVEAALSAGVSRAAVLQALNDQGFTMTPKSFESALYRIRKKRTQPAKPVAKLGHDQAEPASQPAQAPQEEPASPDVPESGDGSTPTNTEGLTLGQRRIRREAKAAEYIKGSNSVLDRLKKESSK